jgi:hypothetical protein
MENIFYIYAHINPLNGIPFYIGKGKGNRAYTKQSRSKWWLNTVNKYGFDVILLEEQLFELEAFVKETYWIKRIGRKDLNIGSLINMSFGGEGNSGRVFSEEHKLKIKLNHKGMLGKKTSEETKEKIRNKNKNRVFTQDWKNKISQSKKGTKTWNKGISNDKIKLGDNPRAKKVIDSKTNTIFSCAKEASLVLGINYTNLVSSLNNKRKNKTNLKYL